MPTSLGRPSLSAFFDDHYAPAIARPGTLADYQGTIRLFSALVGDLFVDGIDVARLVQFRDRLAHTPQPERQLLLDFDEPIDGDQLLLFHAGSPPRKSRRGRPRGPRTINKHLRTMRAVLRKYWRMRSCLQEAPDFHGLWLRQDRRLPRDVTDDQLDAIYRACSCAVYPEIDGLRPGDWWRAFLATALTTGFRRSVLLALRWRWLDLHGRMVRVPAEIDKGHRDRRKPLALVALQHLMLIRGDRELVFPWTRCPRTLDRQWQRIQRAAGIGREDWLRIHDLKAASGTRMARTGASVHAIREHLDHAQLETAMCYIDAAVERRDAVDRIPLPACFHGEDERSEGASG